MDFNKKYKVLIASGGGVFGFISAYFLSKLDIPFDINKLTSIGGTSIGGINSLVLASGKTPQELVKFYYEETPKIFHAPWYRYLCNWYSKYPADGIESALKRVLGDKIFRNIKIPCIIPTVNFKLEVPKVFDNIEEDSDMEVPLWKLGRMTSAAPTFFPPVEHNNDIIIDGGIIENIPIITTVTALKSKLGIDYKDMDVFVIGTGEMAPSFKTISGVETYTSIDWLRRLLIPFTTRGNEQASLFWADQMGFNNFTFFNPVKIEGSMDDPSLVTNGTLEKLCKPHVKAFNCQWNDFINN